MNNHMSIKAEFFFGGDRKK